MASMTKIHRISAKAIVVRDGSVLLIKKKDSEGEFFIFPGGGQEHGENLHQTLIREVQEETGYLIEPRDLHLVRDYIGANHEFAHDSSHFHQVELYFKATLAKDGHSKAHLPDNGQIDVTWLPVEYLSTIRVYPLALREALGSSQTSKIYFGDIN